MQSVIENAQVKCNEANELLKVHFDRTLSIAVKNVYTAIERKNIPELLKRTWALELKYKEVKNRRQRDGM